MFTYPEEAVGLNLDGRWWWWWWLWCLCCVYMCVYL